nr:hypothetical protein [Tanacetum cinerariifolium]
MPPRRLKKKSVKRLVEKRMAKAIEEYEKTKANLDNARSSGGNSENIGGTANVQGCSHKTFMNGKPHPFNKTKGVVGLRRWIEKVEQVFEICKCVEEDKVIFAASTFEGRALTWSKTKDKKLLRLMLQPWLRVEAMLGTYHGATGARHIISQNVTCFGCGEKGHYKDKCPRGRNPQNEGARGGVYVMRTKDSQQDLNVIT